MNTANSSAINAQLAELAATREKTAALETSIADARNTALRSLHTDFGFASTVEFLAAYKLANGSGKGRKATKGATGKPGTRKARVSITPERRAEMKKFFKDGGSTVDAVSKFNISVATAQNIKADAGMVKSRS